MSFKTKIMRYFQPAKNAVVSESASVELVDDHLEKEVGPIAWVEHEIASEYVHVDIHVVAPTKARNYYTLLTSGMSDRRMSAPEGREAFARAELMLCLRPEDYGKDRSDLWPSYLLRCLAKFPHQFETWLWWGHSVPNGDPAKPYDERTRMAGAVLLSPALFPDTFTVMRSTDEAIYIFSVIPVYEEEMQFKIEFGAEEFEKLLAKRGVTELLDQSRKSVVVQ